MTSVSSTLSEILVRLGLRPEDLPACAPFTETTELVSVGADCNGREAFLAPTAADAWQRMRAAAEAEGLRLLPVSAFRSYEHQARLFEKKLRAGQTVAEIRRVLAVPGFSQHHTGGAIDVGAPDCADLTERFETTPEFRWLTARAGAFGFEMSYPRGNRLGVAYEPWHWFFADRAPANGTAAARAASSHP